MNHKLLKYVTYLFILLSCPAFIFAFTVSQNKTKTYAKHNISNEKIALISTSDLVQQLTCISVFNAVNNSVDYDMYVLPGKNKSIYFGKHMSKTIDCGQFILPVNNRKLLNVFQNMRQHLAPVLKTLASGKQVANQDWHNFSQACKIYLDYQKQQKIKLNITNYFNLAEDKNNLMGSSILLQLNKAQHQVIKYVTSAAHHGCLGNKGNDPQSSLKKAKQNNNIFNIAAEKLKQEKKLHVKPLKSTKSHTIDLSSGGANIDSIFMPKNGPSASSNSGSNADSNSSGGGSSSNNPSANVTPKPQPNKPPNNPSVNPPNNPPNNPIKPSGGNTPGGGGYPVTPSNPIPNNHSGMVFPSWKGGQIISPSTNNVTPSGTNISLPNEADPGNSNFCSASPTICQEISDSWKKDYDN